MPLATENLTKDSTKEQILKAISATISMEIKAGRDRDQAVAIAFASARKKVGSRPYLREK